MTINFDAIKEEVLEAIKDSASRVSGHAQAEFEALGKELAEKVIKYASDADARGMDITLARIRLLEERLRVNVNNEFWITVETVCQTSFRIILATLAAV